MLSRNTYYTVAALLSFLFSLWVQQVVFDGIPHVTDATSHLFQAKIFASGRLTSIIPTCYNFFFQDNVIMSGSGLWHTKYSPGQALWLSWGVFAHIAWLPMPLATTASTLSLMYICEKLFNRTTSLLSGLLFALSPLVLLLGGSFMSHTTFLFFLLLAFALEMNAVINNRKSLHILAGLAAGMACITRTPDFIVIFFSLSLAFLIRNCPRKEIIKGLPYSILGSMAPIVFLLFWNHTLYGYIFSFGYNLGVNPSLTPIINDSIGFDEHFTLNIAFRHLLWTWLRFNKVMLGWPCSLLFIPLAFFSREKRSYYWLCLFGMVSITALYFFWPYYGFEYEARYYSSLLPFAIILTLGGIKIFRFFCLQIFQKFQQTNQAKCSTNILTTTCLLMFYIYAGCYYWPVYLWPIYSKAYENASTIIHDHAQQTGLSNAIVLIPSRGKHAFLYSSGFVYNDPDLSNNVIYARDLGANNRCLYTGFSHRIIYRFKPNKERFNRPESVAPTNSCFQRIRYRTNE